MCIKIQGWISEDNGQKSMIQWITFVNCIELTKYYTKEHCTLLRGEGMIGPNENMQVADSGYTVTNSFIHVTLEILLCMLLQNPNC